MMFNRVKNRAVFLGLLCTISVMGCNSDPSPGELLFSDAWLRESPPGARMNAAYGDFHNTGGTAIEISGFNSTDFESVSLHQTVQEDGKSRMKSVPSLSLSPGSTVSLAPGGMHLMTSGPRVELREGDIADITVNTADGRSFQFRLTVERR